jgi:hypothetical protein
VARNFLFEKKSKKLVEWEGAIFSFKIKDAVLEEQEPQILIQSDEPIYQLKVLKDDFNPTLAAASRLKKLFILTRDRPTSRWTIITSINNISTQRIFD